MSRREAVLKATAGALQPKAHDISEYRQRSVRERRMKVRGEDAAGALAFAALDQHEGLDGLPTTADDPGAVKLPGDRLGPILLRLKYADQHSRELFDKAYLILVHRHGGLHRKRRTSMVLHGIVLCAIFEWVHDACPACRGDRQGSAQPKACPVCAPPKKDPGRGKPIGRRDVVEARDSTGRLVQGLAAVMEPRRGCPKCGGLGRVFRARKTPRGVRCVPCNNTGRVSLSEKRRWAIVNEFVTDAQRKDGVPATGISKDAFRGWLSRYHRYLELLRAADKRMAGSLDFGISPYSIRDTDSGLEQKEDAPGDESDEISDRAGEVPPS